MSSPPANQVGVDRSPDGVRSRLQELLAPPATELVRAFFLPENDFAADTFDTIGTNDPSSIGRDDLLAVTYLDVRFGPQATRLLLGELAETATQLLQPPLDDVPLWSADDATLDQAEELWRLLCRLPMVGEVTAGKLLARKRPRLIPVVDHVICRALDPEPGQVWSTLRECLRSDVLRDTVEGLRPGGCRVSTLRLLDVAVWMRCSRGQKARRAQRDAGLPG